ncbi:MAG: zf-TFIIB domain-containing protein [Cyanobacteria bacterium P01_D01_bin.56]
MCNSTKLEPRRDCPVCVGLPMQKLKITQKDGSVFLTLDNCQRCGGVWFDKDEVKLSQQITSPKMQQRITQSPALSQSHCQQCNTLMDRNLKQCPACGWHNQISCPVCQQTLQRKQHNQLTLDVCHSCHGVWFDQVELLALWNSSLTGLSTTQTKALNHPPQPNDYQPTSHITQIVGEAIAEASIDGIVYSADIIEPGAQLIAHTAKGSVEVVSKTSDIAGGTVEALAKVTGATLETVGELPEAVTIVLEVTGELAGGIVEGLAELIAALF